MNPLAATGAIPSPVDYRDRIAAASAVPIVPVQSAIPATMKKTPLGGVLMQAQEPDCVLFSVVKLMKLYLFVTTGQWVDLSPRFLAILIKRYDGQDRETGGTYPRLALKLAVKYGCCTTALLPNDTTLPVLEYRKDSLLTQAMFDEALQHRIPGYIGVPVDFNATREALHLYKAVSTLFYIGNELWTPSWAKRDIDPMRTPKSVVSGHQMTQNGYGVSLNAVENQWSEGWADAGANEFDFKAWQPFILEQWAVAKVPDDVASFIKSLPAAADFHYQWNAHMAQGMTPNEDTRMFQVALMILGFLAPVPPEDFGIFGPKTAAANSRFQAANGISAMAPRDVGPLTRAALNKLFLA